MKTLTGKIARLPKLIRHQLGQRLEDGQSAAEILDWLNPLPAVQLVLDKHFAARPITEQNLSDWRQSGHLHWLRQQAAQASALQFIEQADDLQEPLQERHLTDRFAVIVSAELTRLAMTLLEQETDPEKQWQRLCQVNRELSRLRRDDHRATAAAIQQERWDWEYILSQTHEEERLDKEQREQQMEILLGGEELAVQAQLFGGGEKGWAKAEKLYRLKCGQDMEDLRPAGKKPGKKPVKPKKSCPIVPNKTKPASHRNAAEAEGPTASSPEPSPTSPTPSTTPIAPQDRADLPVSHATPHPTASNPIQPTPPLDRSAGGSPASSPEPSTSANPPLTPEEARREAENCRLRMEWNFEPRDEAKLRQLYAAIPAEESQCAVEHSFK